MLRAAVLYTVLFLLICSTSIAASSKTPLVVVDKTRSASVVKQVPLTGTVTSPKLARLSSQVSGQVKRINVDIGDRVKKGDMLLHLDSELEELTLKAAQAATQQARAALDDAKRRFESAQRLRTQNSISIDEIENRESEVKIDEAALKRLMAEEKKQKAIVGRHSLRSPFAGVISEKMTEAGEWIEPGKPVLTLVAIDELRVDFQVPQEFYSSIDNKSRISVSLNALPGKKFDGSIDAIVPVSDPSARTFLMRVLIDRGSVNMTPGMSVNGSLRLNTGSTGVVVSRDALLRYPDGRVTVWVVERDGSTATVTEKLVKVGHSFDGQVTILDGVDADVTVVVQGNESLQDGQTVRIHNSQ